MSEPYVGVYVLVVLAFMLAVFWLYRRAGRRRGEPSSSPAAPVATRPVERPQAQAQFDGP